MRRILFFIIAALLTCQVYAQPLPEGAPGVSDPSPAAVPGAQAQTSQPDAPAAPAPEAEGTTSAAPADGTASPGLATPDANGAASPSIKAASASGTPNVTMTPLGQKSPASPPPRKRASHNEKMPNVEHIIMLDASGRMQEAGYGTLQSGFKRAPALFAALLKPDGKHFHSRDAVTIIPFSNLQDQAIDGHNPLGNLKLSDLAKVLLSGTIHGPGKGELKGGLLKPLSRAVVTKPTGIRFFWIFTKQDLSFEDKNNSIFFSALRNSRSVCIFFSALRNSRSVSCVWYAPLGVLPGAKEKACLYLVAAGTSFDHSPWLEGFIDTLNTRLSAQVPGSKLIRLKVFAQKHSKRNADKSEIPLTAYFFRTKTGENTEAPFMENGHYVLDLKPDGKYWKANVDFDIFYPDGWKFSKGSFFPKTGNGHTVTKKKKESRLVKVETEQTVTEPDETGRAHVHWDVRVSDLSVRRYLLRSEDTRAIDVKISIKDKTKYQYGSGEEGTFSPDASFLAEQGFEDMAKFMIFDNKGKNMKYDLLCRPISLRLVADDSRTPSSMLTLGGAVLVVASLVGFALGNKKKVKPAAEPARSESSQAKPETASADAADKTAEKPADGSPEEPGAETGSASEENTASGEDTAASGEAASGEDAGAHEASAENAESGEPKPETESASDATSAEQTEDNSANQPSE
ncbi:MAG: hypothetical protein K6G50_06490 [bacterium]|nr:hypothetical protein [bacterium]